MAFSNYFSHDITRKYTALFGSLFNEITIERKDEDDNIVKKMIVPISFANWQKLLAKKIQTPGITNPTAVSLPRIAFEIGGFTYDETRKLSSTKKYVLKDGAVTYVPTPYNIEFTLSIMGKYLSDIHKIMEQIIPFFTPDYIPSVKIIPSLDPIDIPITLTSTSIEDAYEGSLEERRAIVCIMTFTMKAYYYGPTQKRKLIKFVEVDINEPEAAVEMKLYDRNNRAKHFSEVEDSDNWGIETIIIEGTN